MYFVIFFYTGKSTFSCAKYYREFPDKEEMNLWATSVRNECNYFKYRSMEISEQVFMNATADTSINDNLTINEKP